MPYLDTLSIFVPGVPKRGCHHIRDLAVMTETGRRRVSNNGIDLGEGKRARQGFLVTCGRFDGLIRHAAASGWQRGGVGGGL